MALLISFVIYPTRYNKKMTWKKKKKKSLFTTDLLLFTYASSLSPYVGVGYCPPLPHSFPSPSLKFLRCVV